MDDQAVKPARKTTRARKTTTAVADASNSSSQITVSLLEETFLTLLQQITQAKTDFSNIQRMIEEMRQSWEREQKEHELLIAQQHQQEELDRKREKEMYEYETAKMHRKAEDEFSEKRVKWERELSERKDEIAKEKKELEDLRKLVTGFEAEKQKAIKDATVQLEKTLTEQFSNERKLREQEVKAEKELLGLRITNLTQENQRQEKEIQALKTALEDATRQLKDVAVRVIESSNVYSKQQSPIAPS